MPLPTVNDVQAVEPVLQNMLVGYINAESRFVAERVFPPVAVDKDSGTFYVFTKKYWFLDEMEERAPGQQYPRGDFAVETDTYKTLQYALSRVIPDETRANSQIPMDLEQASMRWLAHEVLIRKERAFAADFMKTSVWTTDTSVSNKWSDYAASDPVADFRNAKRTISQLTGLSPNTAVMGEIVADRLANHPDLIDRLKYVVRADADTIEGGLAALFGIGQILVGEAIYNSANEGQAASLSAIVDDDCLVAYVAPNPGLFEASAGYTFAWAPGGGTGSAYPIVRLDENDADMIKVKMQWDQKVVSADCGVFHSDCVD